MWWPGPCARGGGAASGQPQGNPGSRNVCRGRLGFSGATDPGEAAQGFAGASLQEPFCSHSLQRLLQELASSGETLGVAPELLELDDFAVLARYDAEPTPLPAERRLLLEQLEAFHAEVLQRLS